MTPENILFSDFDLVGTFVYQGFLSTLLCLALTLNITDSSLTSNSQTWRTCDFLYSNKHLSKILYVLLLVDALLGIISRPVDIFVHITSS